VAKDFPFSQFALAAVSALVAMESAVSELMITSWATVAAVLFGELFWRAEFANKLRFRTKIFCITVFAACIYTATFFQFIQPNIVLQTGNEAPFILTDVTGNIWARVRLNNRGWREVVCRFFLNSLEEKGLARPVMAGEALQLWPAGNEVGEGGYDRTIPSKDWRVFNIAYVKTGDNQLSIPSDQFQRQVASALGPGIYKFNVQATRGTCRSASKDIWIKYDGDNKISFIDGR
jgi:hypothetical protein